jgi:hypothetical protein
MSVKPTLKCVIAWSDRRNLCSLVADVLRERIGPHNVLQLGDDAFAVYAPEEPAEIRDRMADVLMADETAIVVEFERWSSFGKLDTAWLMERGH